MDRRQRHRNKQPEHFMPSETYKLVQEMDRTKDDTQEDDVMTEEEERLAAAVATGRRKSSDCRGTRTSKMPFSYRRYSQQVISLSPDEAIDMFARRSTKKKLAEVYPAEEFAASYKNRPRRASVVEMEPLEMETVAALPPVPKPSFPGRQGRRTSAYARLQTEFGFSWKSSADIKPTNKHMVKQQSLQNRNYPSAFRSFETSPVSSTATLPSMSCELEDFDSSNSSFQDSGYLSPKADVREDNRPQNVNTLSILEGNNWDVLAVPIANSNREKIPRQPQKRYKGHKISDEIAAFFEAPPVHDLEIKTVDPSEFECAENNRKTIYQSPPRYNSLCSCEMDCTATSGDEPLPGDAAKQLNFKVKLHVIPASDLLHYKQRSQKLWEAKRESDPYRFQEPESVDNDEQLSLRTTVREAIFAPENYAARTQDFAENIVNDAVKSAISVAKDHGNSRMCLDYSNKQLFDDWNNSNNNNSIRCSFKSNDVKGSTPESHNIEGLFFFPEFVQYPILYCTVIS